MALLSTLRQGCRYALDNTAIWRWYRGRRDHEEVGRWERSGKPSPPPHGVKQIVLKKYAADFGAETMVETGTYLGDMVFAVADCFKRIVSVELSTHLYLRAQRRFRKVRLRA